MSFKQKYLCQNGPFPFDFQSQRTDIFNRILTLIKSNHPNQWNIKSISPLYYIQSMKQVYGLKAQELATFINYLLDLLKQPNLESEPMLIIMKTLNNLRDYKINARKLITSDNHFFLDYIQQIMEKGCKFQIKSIDNVLDQFLRTVRHFCEYGDDIVERVIKLAIKKRENKFIALFSRSIKSQQNALMILEKLFAQSSVWDRDACFYYIISQITRKFPKINYSPYYDTLFHETIKIITTIIDPTSQDDIKKVIIPESSLNLPPILKSIANILVNLLKPVYDPNWQAVWTCIERIFSLIGSTLDHFRQTQYMNDFLMFMKQFVKSYTQRYRVERKLFEIVNEDFIQQFNGQPNGNLVLTEQYNKLFINLWPQIIPQLLFLQDNDVRVARILYQLVLFSPQNFLAETLTAILKFLDRDITIVSIFSSKMTILLLEQYVIKNYCGEHEMTLLIQCCNSLLVSMEKLGVSENLDTLQLVMRCFLHFPQNHIDNILVQNLVDDIMNILIDNMDAMSINLEGNQSEQAQLFIDLRNIYFPFIIRLNDTQIRQMSDKMLYKIRNNIPEHRQAYQFLTVALCYVNKNLPVKILDFVYKQIVTHNPNHDKHKKQNSSSVTAHDLIPIHPQYTLSISNEEHIKWYCSIIQCSFQYHPRNIINQWSKIEKIVVVMLRQWQKNNIMEWGLDLLFNLLINLCHIHLPWQQFTRQSNYKYQTMQNLSWQETSQQQKQLSLKIKQTFFDGIQSFIHRRYDEVIASSQVFRKLNSDKIITIPHKNKQYSICVKQSHNTVVNSLLSSQAIPSIQDLNQKKIIYKALSIQYTVFSAFQERSCYLQSIDYLKQIKGFFIGQFKSLRSSTIEYLKYIKGLLCHYNILGDPNVLKTFHFFWREAHDELFFSSALMSTKQKLQPHYHPHLHKKKQLFSSPFLIISELYVSIFRRIELHCNLIPMAYLNDPKYFDDVVPFSFSGVIDTSLKSPVPIHLNVHQQCHQPIINITRLKFSCNSEEGYGRKYCQNSDKTIKQRYLQALRNIILALKRNQVIFMYGDCYRDPILWYQVVQILDFHPKLQKKGDKAVIIDILYLLIIFTVDSKGSIMYLKNDEKQNKRKLSQNIEFMEGIITKIQQALAQKLQKSVLLLGVIMMCFQEYIPLEHQIHLKIFPLVVQLCSEKNQNDQNNIGRTIFYRYINRVIKTKVFKTKIDNKPIKRPFNQYLIYRNIGGQTKDGCLQPAKNIKTDKVDNYFYPLRKLQKITINTLNPYISLEKLVLEMLQDEKIMLKIYESFKDDYDLKSDERDQNITLDIDQPKKVSCNGHKIINYIFDCNPEKLDVFSSFVDNFVSYPTLFYHKLYRKMFLMGKEKTIQMHKKIVMNGYNKCENQQKKLRQFIMAQLLPHLRNDEEYLNWYRKQIGTCSNEDFNRINNCLLVVFCIDWRINIQLYPKIIKELKQQPEGRNYLRILMILNNFILCTGRFGRKFAVEAIQQMLNIGIKEGTDEVSDLLVSMLVFGFIIPINLQVVPDWVQEPLQQLLKSNKISQITDTAGYQIDPSLIKFLDTIILQCEQQKQISSKNLKTYSKIANKILSSITVYRFNKSFYDLLKTTIMHFLNKLPSVVIGMPSIDQQASLDDDIIAQLKESQYPQNIYEDIMNKVLQSMKNDKISITRKKLKYLQGITINRCFVKGKIMLPPFFGVICPQTNGNTTSHKQADKQRIYIEHIIAVSNIARIMKDDELTTQVNCVLANKKDMKNVYMMMSLLLAAGTREFQWRQKLLNEIVAYKKFKIIKQFISYWWKGRSPQTQQQQRLYILVRSVQNPYSYFA